TAALRDFAKQHKMTLNTLFQGAWALLLSRYGGENDVLFGAIVSGRSVPLSGIESMVRLFVNLLPVRVQISSGERALTYLQNIQARQIETRQYEYTPLVQVKKWSALPQSQPMFESILIFENWFGDISLAEAGRSLEIRDMEGFQKGLGHPIAVAVEPGEALSISINYDRERFDAETIRRMLGHYQTLLQGIVAAPDARLAEIPILSTAEREQMLVRWNDTATDYAREQCLHEVFEALVERTPDAVALVFEDQQLTYRELNARANRLAHYLRKCGIGPESLVGIYVERSLDMFVALLGVLKSGGAYVPLDPMYPQERVAFALQETQAPVLLTQNALLADLPEHDARVICLDRDWPEIATACAANPVTLGTPANLAYVIFTSGSTGKPKGVSVAHQGLVNLMNAMRCQPGLDASDVFPCFTTISFDMAVPELYLPLVTGARIVLMRREVALDGRRLASMMAETNVTVLQATPTTWRMLLEANWIGDKEFKMICGAEAMPADLPGLLLDKGASLWNMYGPTETT
ncbi:MAG: AMP-binding protein, partial [bacterium]